MTRHESGTLRKVWNGAKSGKILQKNGLNGKSWLCHDFVSKTRAPLFTERDRTRFSPLWNTCLLWRTLWAGERRKTRESSTPCVSWLTAALCFASCFLKSILVSRNLNCNHSQCPKKYRRQPGRSLKIHAWIAPAIPRCKFFHPSGVTVRWQGYRHTACCHHNNTTTQQRQMRNWTGISWSTGSNVNSLKLLIWCGNSPCVIQQHIKVSKKQNKTKLKGRWSNLQWISKQRYIGVELTQGEPLSAPADRLVP